MSAASLVDGGLCKNPKSAIRIAFTICNPEKLVVELLEIEKPTSRRGHGEDEEAAQANEGG